MTISKLTALQQDFLEIFFRLNKEFFLTGGAALAGFHIGHRETHDLDLFTLEDAMLQGMEALTAAARELEATLEAIHTAPDFRRVLLLRGSEALVVDLVRERAPQTSPEKPVVNGIRVDPPKEILANKLCALLGRAEIRDLVDVQALEQAGHPVESALEAAAAKDKGFTPAQLSWVLSQIEIGDNLSVPGGASVTELRQYLAELIIRLARRAFPASSS